MTIGTRWVRLAKAATAFALAGVGACLQAHGATARAEIQVGLCGSPAEIERALKLRPREAPYEVWQFDDASLTLLAHGLRLRLRLKSSRSELTLKVAGQDCEQLVPDLVPTREGKCEYDVYGAQRAGAVSLNTTLDAKTTGDLLAGRLAMPQALSTPQVRYLRDVIHYWPLPTGLLSLGPIKAHAYETRDKTYDIDVHEMPDGARYTEITRKVPLADADDAFRTLQAYLANAGIAECADRSAQAANKLRALLPRR